MISLLSLLKSLRRLYWRRAADDVVTERVWIEVTEKADATNEDDDDGRRFWWSNEDDDAAASNVIIVLASPPTRVVTNLLFIQ